MSATNADIVRAIAQALTDAADIVSRMDDLKKDEQLLLSQIDVLKARSDSLEIALAQRDSYYQQQDAKGRAAVAAQEEAVKAVIKAAENTAADIIGRAEKQAAVIKADCDATVLQATENTQRIYREHEAAMAGLEARKAEAEGILGTQVSRLASLKADAEAEEARLAKIREAIAALTKA